MGNLKKILATSLPFILLAIAGFSLSSFVTLVGMPAAEVSKAKLIAAFLSKRFMISFISPWCIWLFYSYAFSYLTKRPFYPTLRLHAWAYLPAFLFLLYPLQFKDLYGVKNFYYIEGLERILIPSAILLVILLKLYLARRFLSPTSALITLALLILLIQQWIISAAYFHNGVDDAYISFRYAQNWVAGNGLVFNPGERIEGYTNFLWTILLGLGIGMGLDPLLLSKILGVLSALGVVMLLPPLSRRCPSDNTDRRKTPLVGLLAILFLIADGSFIWWSVSGMETLFFTLLVTVGIMAYLKSLTKGPFFALIWVVMFYLAALTRPEGLLVFGVTVCHKIIYHWIKGERDKIPQALIGLAVFMTLYLPYYTWRYLYYGYPLPNTFYVKVGSGWHQVARGFQHLSQFIKGHNGYYFFIGFLLISALRYWSTTWCSYLIACLVSYLAFIVYVGGDWSFGRFFVPLLPIIYLLIALGLKETYLALRDKLAVSPSMLQAISYPLIILIVAGIYWGSAVRGEYNFVFIIGKADKQRVEVGKWLQQNASGTDTVAVLGAGAIPYYSGLRCLDSLGLNDLYIAHKPVLNMGQGAAGHEKYDADYILAQRPTFIIEPLPILASRTEFLASYRPITYLILKSPVLTAYQRKPEKERGIDSRLPHRLKTQIRLLDMPEQISASQIFPLTISVKNTGDTLWLKDWREEGGFVRLGMQLADSTGKILDKEYARAALPKDISPGEEISMTIALKAPVEPGKYELKMDLVDELIDWFETRQSPPLLLAIEVL